MDGQCPGARKAEAAIHQHKARLRWPEQPHPAKDIAEATWRGAGIRGGHHSAGGLGSTGVFFFDLKDDAGIVVFKQASQSTPSELFCAKIYKHFGIRSPAMRVLPRVCAGPFAESVSSFCCLLLLSPPPPPPPLSSPVPQPEGGV